MYNANLTNTTYTLIHDGRSLANIYCSAALRLATSNSPDPSNVASWPGNVPLYLPQGDPTYASTATGNATIHVVKNYQ